MSSAAFSRSLRAHFLTETALMQLMFDDLKPEVVPAELLSFATSFLKNEVSPGNAAASPLVVRVLTALESAMREKEKSRMGRLWLSYIRMVQIMKLFVCAERSGNWQLHLHAVTEIIPYFAAAGHTCTTLNLPCFISST